jgi:hypothetical protein
LTDKSGGRDGGEDALGASSLGQSERRTLHVSNATRLARIWARQTMMMENRWTDESRPHPKGQQ